jgi:chemotaxis protein CheC
MPFLELNSVQLDTLKGVKNIGMGHVATALSQMIGQRVNLAVPNVTNKEINQVLKPLGDAEKMTVGITLQIFGDARGSIMLLFSQERAHSRPVACLVTRKKGWL